jgi:hypothetical protein
MRGAGHIAYMAEMSITIFLENVKERKRSLGKHRRRWKVSIKVCCIDIGNECVEWIHQAQDRDQRWAVLYTEITFQFHIDNTVSLLVE